MEGKRSSIRDQIRKTDREINRMEKDIKKMLRLQQRNKKRAERRNRIKLSKVQESERKFRKVNREVAVVVNEIANEPITRRIHLDKDLERFRTEEEEFQKRYNEQGPWTRVSTKTIVKSGPKRISAEGSIDSRTTEQMDVDDSDGVLEIHLTLEELEI